MNKARGKLARIHYVSRLNLAQISLSQQLFVAAFQLDFNQSLGERCCVYGNIEFIYEPRYSANVVFVSVGNKQALNLIAVFSQISEVGNDYVDSQHVIVREAHAAVDDDDFVFVLEDCHVFADFVHASERNYS